MLTAEELQTMNISTLEEGWEYIEEINARQHRLLEVMGDAESNPVWQDMCDRRYELSKAKRHIQAKMAKIVAKRLR